MGRPAEGSCTAVAADARARPRTVFLFAGQGAQHPQMGRELFERNHTFRAWMERLDAHARDLCGESIVAVLYDPKLSRDALLDELCISHPAIFMVEYALARATMAAGVWPDLVMGASLGSFAAASVADVFAPETALEAVIQQAAALEACSDSGGMMAILDAPGNHLPWLHGRCEVAAINFARHFVIAAPDRELASIETELKLRRVAFQRLPVRFPFHSAWIDGAESPFVSYCTGLRFAPPRIELVCSEQARVLHEIPQDFLWRVVRHPIRFADTVVGLASQEPFHYIDLSPSATLATFLRYMLPPPHSARAALSRYGDDCLALETLAHAPT
jgi:bacillaene synthase trans-acting acyltransferase